MRDLKIMSYYFRLLAPGRASKCSEYVDSRGCSGAEVLHMLVEVEMGVKSYTQDLRGSLEWKADIVERDIRMQI